MVLLALIPLMPADARSTTAAVDRRHVAFDSVPVSAVPGPKVVGGKKAKAGRFPWHVSLNSALIEDAWRGHRCGAAVLSATWVATAAHCFDEVPTAAVAMDVIVVAGVNELNEGGERRNVRRLIRHPEYRRRHRYESDIALVELAAPLPLSARVKPIPLMEHDAEPRVFVPGAALSVTGWGAREQGGSNVRDLRHVTIPLVEDRICQTVNGEKEVLLDSMFCAGVSSGKRDTCQGDSGSPITTDGRAPLLVGLVSWGEGCGKPNAYGVYARLAGHITDWINGCLKSAPECAERTK